MADNKRSTSWTFIIYDESVMPGWLDYLNDLHVAVAISPVHDKDINPDGEPKKSHRHVVIKFDSLKSFDQVSAISHDLLNGTIPQICHSLRGATRYLIHLDNPEKYQYHLAEIVTLGGFDIDEALKPTASATFNALTDILEFCYRSGITEYFHLVRWSLNSGKCSEVWRYSILHNTIAINSFLSSYRACLKDSIADIDVSTLDSSIT